MSRDYKNLTKGCCYHVYNRGHGYRNIFNDDQDYRNFIKRLIILLGIENYTKPGNYKGNLRLTPLPVGTLDILAFCLMPNHYHLLIRQNTEIKISVLINRLTTSYCKYFNAKNSTVGGLFQDTFKAKLVENDSYLAYLSAYIHNNNPEDITYPYSSLTEYLSYPRICNTSLILSLFNNNSDQYLEFVIKSKESARNMLEDKGNL